MCLIKENNGLQQYYSAVILEFIHARVKGSFTDSDNVVILCKKTTSFKIFKEYEAIF